MTNATRILNIIDALEELRANVLMEGMDDVGAQLNRAIADLMWLHRNITFYE